MARTLKFAMFAVAAGVLTPACAAPVANEPEQEKADRQATVQPVAQPAARSVGKGVTTTPVPINQRFRTLDEYLAFREKSAAMDNSWYREIRPGVYQLETGNYRGPPIEKRIFTREELMREYGFTR